MIKYIVLAIVFFLTDFLSYKYIRKIDKKERKKIDSEETAHVNLMIEKNKKLYRIKNTTESSEEEENINVI